MIKKTLENLKIPSLNELQLASLEAIAKRGDIILLSPTGTGKTIGFLLPLLTRLQASEQGIQALIVAPSRELVLQIEQVFRSMGSGFKVNSCYGGHSIKTETNNLKTPPAVLIGTPGRIADHLSRERIEPSTIKALVLDEFDKSLEFGFTQEMTYIISRLKNLKKRILTSATDMEAIPSFTGIHSPITLNYLTLHDAAPEKLKLKAVVAEGKDKLATLFKLICKLGDEATLVFCNHREAVERISNLLWQEGLVHDIYHGGMEQEDRERALLKFRNGSLRVLITTDLAARGLDIPEVRNIVHYQLPTTGNTFIHRNGRTARMNAEGTAWLILAENEPQPVFIPEPVETELLSDSYPLPEQPAWITLYFAGGRKDKINKTDIVGLLLQKGGLQKEELGLIEVKDFTSYVAVSREKAKAVVRLIEHEKIKRKNVRVAFAR
ncbi:MAG: DEAD/DEAH box helicase [Bacteroidota bacterium]|nr:DEAD/DEAH box helicase [Bacteroidota bacterium]